MSDKKLTIEEIKKCLNTTAPNDYEPENVLGLMLICGNLIDELEDYRAALEFYANKRSYSCDHDNSLFSRWCILYGDVEEINDSVGYAGKRAREVFGEIQKMNEEQEKLDSMKNTFNYDMFICLLKNISIDEMLWLMPRLNQFVEDEIKWRHRK